MSSGNEEEEVWQCSEDEQEVDLSEDGYQRTCAALHPIAAAAFGHLHGRRQEGEAAAAAAARAPKRRRSAEAAPRHCPQCHRCLVQQPADKKPPVKHPVNTNDNGPFVMLSCRNCGQKQLTQGIILGTCLSMERPGGGKLVGMVRGIIPGTTDVRDAKLHIQHFSSSLALPGACRYEILRDSGSERNVFLLTQKHSNVLVADFAAAWARGVADVLRPPQGSYRLFFQPDQMCDVLAVREEGCPTFACCSGSGCACLNPWAQQGGSPVHIPCGYGFDPAVPVKDGKGGCRLLGEMYAPGDLAWLVPQHARQPEERLRVVDAQLDLVRIDWLGDPFLEDSQELSQLPMSSSGEGLMLRYERFELSSSVDGFCYRPTGEQLRCKAKWLRGLADLEHRAPGSRVLDGSGDGEGHVAGGSGSGEGEGTDGSGSGSGEGEGEGEGTGGSGEDAGGSGTHSTVATALPSAACAAADGSGGASKQHTPSGSDCSANPSWCSDDMEASSCDKVRGGSDASSGAASPSTGGGGGMQPPRAGQQGPWPVEICDLFCGAGGLSLGLLASLGPRARVKWAVDLFPEALATYRQCHPGSRTFEEDVCSVLAASRARREGYPPIGCPPGTWRLLVGGPPCQGFSKANTGASPEEKARKNVLVALFVSVLFTLRWPLAIMENVCGLLSAGDTMQRIIQAAVSAGYQVRGRLLNAGCYGLAEHRRRLIVLFARHDVPLPSFPLPHTLFPGAGGYQEPGQPCLLEDREKRAYSGVPLAWRPHVVVPDAAPLPALTARDVLEDLPRQAAGPDVEAQYDREPQCYYAACMRGRGAGGGSEHSGGSSGEGGSGASGSGASTGRSDGRSGRSSHGAAVDLAAVGMPLRNHCIQALEEETLARIRLIPKEGQPPPPGRQRWEGECSLQDHPFRPPRAGNFLDLPAELCTAGLAARRNEAKLWGIYARLKWCSHFATLTTSPQLYSDTTSTILHPEADRPLTVRESARVQGFPDWVEFAGSPALGYKQVGNAVPPPLAEALGRELARALAAAEQQQRQQPRR